MKITEITAEKKENKIQRLAAYCRVSSDSADQLHSFAAQKLRKAASRIRIGWNLCR